jgi:uncharacterized membrane protein
MNKIVKPNKSFLLRFSANYRGFVALGAAIIVFLATKSHFTLPEVVLFTWISFSLVIIILDWIIILSSHPREVRKIARLQDSSQSFIFLFVLAASVVSMGAIIFLLKSAKSPSHQVLNEHILLSMVAVVVSWWLVHTLFTLRYAHLYYDTDTDEGKPQKAAGLIFPGDEEPDYMDFVYFSFVLGMTFQVSDVNVSSKRLRRLAWLHGMLSFGFNTAILALSINVISGLVAQ